MHLCWSLPSVKTFQRHPEVFNPPPPHVSHIFWNGCWEAAAVIYRRGRQRYVVRETERRSFTSFAKDTHNRSCSELFGPRALIYACASVAAVEQDVGTGMKMVRDVLI